MQRDEIECDLHFLGFLVMENKLKPVTQGILKNLNECNVRTIMATGDNTLTAIAVGREANILERDDIVYFCDIENDRLVWNSTKNEYDQNKIGASDLKVSTGLKTSKQQKDRHSLSADDTKFLPWERDQASTFGVAINGKSLAFLTFN